MTRLDQHASLSGIYALTLLIISTIFFSVIHPDYDHTKQSFSELGAIGAPNYVWFNLVSFGLVGVLSIIFTIFLRYYFYPDYFNLLLFFQLMAAVSWILTGAIPASFTNQLLYNLHIVAAFSTYIFGTLTITYSVKFYNYVPGFEAFSLISILLMFTVAFSIMLSFGEPLITPEWGQLISIFSYFIWQAIYSLLVYRKILDNEIL